MNWYTMEWVQKKIILLQIIYSKIIIITTAQRLGLFLKTYKLKVQQLVCTYNYVYLHICVRHQALMIIPFPMQTVGTGLFYTYFWF